jgi:hypothetical protein
LHAIHGFSIEVNGELCDRKYLAEAMRRIIVIIILAVTSNIALTFL